MAYAIPNSGPCLSPVAVHRLHRSQWRSPVTRDTLMLRKQPETPSRKDNAHGQAYWTERPQCKLSSVVCPENSAVFKLILRYNAFRRGNFVVRHRASATRLCQGYVQMENLILRDKLAIERTKLANERTFLAYFRTGIFFIGSGLSILHIEFFDPVSYLGWTLIGMSPAIISIGIYRLIYTKNSIRKWYLNSSE
jgi:inner membrane protein YidH